MTFKSPPSAYSFASRYGDARSLSPLGEQGDGTRAYIIEGESRYVRGGEGMIDFEGGPFVSTDSFLNTDDTEAPAYLVQQIGTFPCIGANEVVVGAQWLSRENAAHALGLDPVLVDPLGKRSFALITTRI
jgi:hypothetical protein